MRIDIQTSEFEADDRWREHINEKVGKLTRFYDHIEDVTVYLKNESPADQEVELKLGVKDVTLFCKEKSDNMGHSLTLAVDNMAGQLKKYKERH